MKTKIELTDSMEGVLYKMSEGNPGALSVCLKMLEEGKEIDPDDAMGGLGAILSLDTLGLYGPKIWMLYKDVCGCDLSKTLAVLRYWQLGFGSDSEIRHSVENYGQGINLEDICEKVHKRLPRFKLAQPNNPQTERK